MMFVSHRQKLLVALFLVLFVAFLFLFFFFLFFLAHNTHIIHMHLQIASFALLLLDPSNQIKTKQTETKKEISVASSHLTILARARTTKPGFTSRRAQTDTDGTLSLPPNTFVSPLHKEET